MTNKYKWKDVDRLYTHGARWYRDEASFLMSGYDPAKHTQDNLVLVAQWNRNDFIINGVPPIPITPTTLITPATPTTPVSPTTPVTSAPPITPTVSVTPTTPDTPVAPVIPATPDASVTPVTPTTSITPETPVTPVTPINPVTPTTSMTPEVPKQKIPDASSTVLLTGGLDMIEPQIIGSKNDGGHNSNSSDGASTSSNTKVEKLPQTGLISEPLLAIAKCVYWGSIAHNILYCKAATT